MGTGNDLARVLGWGPSCDDDTQLPQILEKLERASTKMLDRWSIMTYEIKIPPKHSCPTTPEGADDCQVLTGAERYTKTVEQMMELVPAIFNLSLLCSSSKLNKGSNISTPYKLYCTRYYTTIAMFQILMEEICFFFCLVSHFSL